MTPDPDSRETARSVVQVRRPMRVAVGVTVIVVLIGFLVLGVLTYHREVTRAVDAVDKAADAVAERRWQSSPGVWSKWVDGALAGQSEAA